MFGRKKDSAVDTARHDAAAALTAATALEEDGSQDASPSATRGVRDVSEIDAREAYMDFGSLLIAQPQGGAVRLEVDERSQRPRAVHIDLEGSSVQLQAFAAPKSTGLWESVRGDLTESLNSSSGSPQAVEGTHGIELRARFPARTSQGQSGFRPVRFVGVDGPRWFLRAVVSGPAAIQPEAVARMDEVISSVVVCRGDEPLPPREPLALQVPENASTRRVEPARGQASEPAAREQPRRGPEMTETR